jgi:hypothetical protein
MPVFQVELDDGRKLHIDADDQQSALAGVQHFTNQSAPSTSTVDAFGQGIADTARGIGRTLNLGGDSPTAEGIAKGVENPNYQPANPMKNGIGDVPRALAENAAPLATQVGAGVLAKAVSKGLLRLPGPYAKGVGLAVGLGTAALENAGNNFKAAAVSRTGDPNATPNTHDIVQGGAATGGQLLADSVLQKRFLGGAEPIRAGGVTGASAALAKLGKTAVVGAGSGTVQQAIGDANAGKMPTFEDLGNAGIKGAATAAALATPAAVGDVSSAAKYRGVTADLQPAAARVANTMQEEAQGKDLSNPSVGKEVLTRASGRVNDALKQAVDPVKDQLTPQAQSVISAAQAGQHLSPQDYATLQASLPAQHADNIIQRVQDAHVVNNILPATGSVGDHSFTGGLTSKVMNTFGLSGHNVAKAATLGILAEHLGSHFITHSPESLALGAGAAGASYLMDKLTGARAPANRFVNRFADPNAGVSANVTPPTPAPQNLVKPMPWGTPPAASSVPSVAQGPALARPPAGFGPLMTSYVAQANRQGKQQARAAQQAQNQQRQATVAAAAPLLAKLAAAQKPQAPPTSVNPNDLPTAITRPAKNIMKGAASATGMREDYSLAQQKAEALRQQAAGQAQARAEAARSPLIADVGGLGAVENPAAVKQMGQYVSGANLIKKLRAIKEESEGAAAEPKVKSNGSANGNGHAAEAPVEEAPFDPKGLKITKVNDADRAVAAKAASEFATSSQAPPVVVDRYRTSTATKQARIRDRLLEASGDPTFPAEDVGVMEHLSQLKDLRGHNDVLDHIARAPMEHQALLKRYFGPKWAESIWKKPKSERK